MGAFVVVAAVSLLGFVVSRRVPGGSRQLPAGWRKVFLIAHVTSAIGWLGVVAGLIALSIAGETRAMLLFDAVFLGYASPLALATGLVLALGTRWGLLRHWWVTAKLVATVALMVTGVLVLHQEIQGGQVSQMLVGGCVISAVVLLGAVVLSVFKPGRNRKQRPMRLVVSEVDTPVAGVRTVRLSRRRRLPSWTPGSHVDLVLPSGTVRQYSLIGDPADRFAYWIAVRLVRGGSAEVHGLRVGDEVGVRAPRNRFPLVAAPRYVFIAGGIGITPLLPMIEQVARDGADWHLVYAGRAPMPFAGWLRGRYPGRVTVEHGRPDLPALLRSRAPGTAVYCCGPSSMIAAVEELVPADALHVERFTTRAGGPAFEVELARTGEVLAVPEGRPLLDVLRTAVPGADSACGVGFCGTCEVPVVAGTPQHHDDVPGRPPGVIYPCVSRASGRLVLDL